MIYKGVPEHAAGWTTTQQRNNNNMNNTNDILVYPGKYSRLEVYQEQKKKKKRKKKTQHKLPVVVYRHLLESCIVTTAYA